MNVILAGSDVGGGHDADAPAGAARREAARPAGEPRGPGPQGGSNSVKIKYGV